MLFKLHYPQKLHSRRWLPREPLNRVGSHRLGVTENGNGVLAPRGIVREDWSVSTEAPAPPGANHTIGCIILTLPFFLEDSAFLPVPEDFHPNTLQGRRYKTDSGTGRELRENVRARRKISQRSGAYVRPSAESSLACSAPSSWLDFRFCVS